MLPAIFLSRGAPTLPLAGVRARAFLKGLAPHLCERPIEGDMLPSFVALGAGGGGSVRDFHQSKTHGILHMDAYAFGGRA